MAAPMPGKRSKTDKLIKLLEGFSRDCYIKPDRIHITVPHCLKADSVQVTWGLVIKCEARLAQSKALNKLGQKIIREWND